MDKKGCVIALGMFDGLHKGHRAVLSAAKRMAERLNTDSAVYTFIENPKTLFGGIPFDIQTYAEKESAILDFGIDHVYSEHFTLELAKIPAESFLERFMAAYEPSGLVAGEDYTFGDRALGNSKLLSDFCKSHGIECEIVPLVMDRGEKISSTRIRAAISSGDLQSLSELK